MGKIDKLTILVLLLLHVVIQKTLNINFPPTKIGIFKLTIPMRSLEIIIKKLNFVHFFSNKFTEKN